MMNFFERIKLTLLKLATSRGMEASEIQENWSLNYKRNADEEFLSDALTLSELIRVHRDAMGRGDLLTARCALIDAQGFAHNLSGFFFAMKEDLFRAADNKLNRNGASSLDWPALPQRYVYPNEYGYRASHRVVKFGNENYEWDEIDGRWKQVVDAATR